MRVFTDKASGTLDKRPELDQVLDHLRPRDTLVVWRLDRLGRNLRHLIATVTDLSARQVAFRSLTEGIDTITPAGRLVFHGFGAMAESEVALIRERATLSLAAPALRPNSMGADTLNICGALPVGSRLPDGTTLIPAQAANAAIITAVARSDGAGEIGVSGSSTVSVGHRSRTRAPDQSQRRARRPAAGRLASQS